MKRGSDLGVRVQASRLRLGAKGFEVCGLGFIGWLSIWEFLRFVADPR